jgi:hypothetical protein
MGPAPTESESVNNFIAFEQNFCFRSSIASDSPLSALADFPAFAEAAGARNRPSIPGCQSVDVSATLPRNPAEVKLLAALFLIIN